jgi:hypothetical protein
VGNQFLDISKVFAVRATFSHALYGTRDEAAFIDGEANTSVYIE